MYSKEINLRSATILAKDVGIERWQEISALLLIHVHYVTKKQRINESQDNYWWQSNYRHEAP